MHRAFAALLGATLLLACEADLQHGLTEAEANELIAALSEAGVSGRKAPDGPAGAWVVQVPSADATRAWQVLRSQGLPRRAVAGFAETYGSGGLVPSPTEEHVRWLRATSGELERSLMAIPGVLDARVHLAAPEPRRWGPAETSVGAVRASLLVVHNPAANGGRPLDIAPLRRLVSGAVPDLAVERVEVIVTSRVVEPAPQQALAQLGPFTVSRASEGPLRAVLVVAGALVVTLSALLVLALRRSRRTRAGAL